MAKKANQAHVVPLENLQDMIFTFRGVQVMLDSDLAQIYGVKVKRLTEQVTRNIERFPEKFRFQLTIDEFENLRSQSATSSCTNDLLSPPIGRSSRHGGRRYLPYVFTEQGVSMLSAVLRSKTAIKVSIRIIEAFVELRRILLNNGQVFARLGQVERRQLAFEIKTENNFEKVFQALESGQNQPAQGIFFDGQMFDAYSFLILDKKHVYHIGASLKDLGKKWFAFSLIDKDAVKIMDRLDKMDNENLSL